jgi:hypothetical protein
VLNGSDLPIDQHDRQAIGRLVMGFDVAAGNFGIEHDILPRSCRWGSVWRKSLKENWPAGLPGYAEKRTEKAKKREDSRCCRTESRKNVSAMAGAHAAALPIRSSDSKTTSVAVRALSRSHGWSAISVQRDTSFYEKFQKQGGAGRTLVGPPRRACKNCPPSVFFISTTCLRACSVLIHTKQRRTP